MSSDSHGDPSRPGHLPDGIVVQPRRFEFRELDAMPRYWFADNALLTAVENAFSLLIPPGERFFIRSVRAYEDRARDPALRELIRGFAAQEALHTRAHDTFNEALGRHGLDVEREKAYAARTIERMERFLPGKMRLGATVFLEHLTATGAHVLFTEPAVAAAMHPEAVRFWRWHGAEEIEHKAVAFDLFREVGGGYVLRVLSALAAVALLAVPFHRMVTRMLREDPRPVTADTRRRARELNRKVVKPQLRMLARFFRPGFHPWREPWQESDQEALRDWYAAPDTAAVETV
jgi:predicted metal-dependent hydrolase